MRVIAGTAKTMPLKAPKGMNTRPTQDRIKETLFNIIQNYVPGSIFLDLYSGSGQIGIEALSRGALHAYFSDTDRDALNVIRDNLTFTRLSDKGTIFRGDAASALGSIHEKHFDIVYMDPPYNSGIEENVLRALSSMKQVDEDTMIIIENEKDIPLDRYEMLGYSVERVKQYLRSEHIFLRKNI
ncbi:MAG: 16S rRNA (guanine(966)-N(2))-methyltransferase RsmD [Lachnospiraceae bacterium]|nr:16S rRNA (guanine(966)-N(2))-methyltransferase RsmD [Lachnospiraceae bacterium]